MKRRWIWGQNTRSVMCFKSSEALRERWPPGCRLSSCSPSCRMWAKQPRSRPTSTTWWFVSTKLSVESVPLHRPAVGQVGSSFVSIDFIPSVASPWGSPTAASQTPAAHVFHDNVSWELGLPPVLQEQDVQAAAGLQSLLVRFHCRTPWKLINRLRHKKKKQFDDLLSLAVV